MLPTPTREGYIFNGWYRKYNRLDMEDFMNFFNEQERLKDDEPTYMTHESDDSYAWAGMTGKAGAEDHRYNVPYLMKGATYRLSYTAHSTRTDEQTTTGIHLYNKNNEYINGTSANSNQWKDYAYTFKVENEFEVYFMLGWNYGERSYFKNIRLECVDCDDYEIEVTSSTTMSETTDHTLYAKWSNKTWDVFAASSYASGSGTAASPYIIKTPEQLAKLALDSRSSALSGLHYRLDADVDMSEHNWGSIKTFVGTLDGGGHVISNLTNLYEVDRDGGFISGTDTGVVLKNIVFRNCILQGDRFTGALVGIMFGGTIENCIVDGVNILGHLTEKSELSLGGLVGTMRGGTLKNCMIMNSSIMGQNIQIGGMVGTARGCQIINCVAINLYLNTLSTDATTNVFAADGISNFASCIASGQVQVATNIKHFKSLIGSSSDFSGFFFSEQINDGYPIPKTLVSLGSVEIPSETIYNALISKGFKTA